MTFKALVYAYILGGFTFIPLVIVALISFTIYTSVPVGDPDPSKALKAELECDSEKTLTETTEELSLPPLPIPVPPSDVNDIPQTRKGWLTMRRTFEESTFDGSYVTLVRSFLDARSKDPKRSRPKDMWYVVLKGKVLYLYEDEGMTECEAVLELGGHDVLIYPEGLLDGELFAKRNAICLRPRGTNEAGMPSLTKEMKFEGNVDVDSKVGAEKEKAIEEEKKREAARDEAQNLALPWYIFVRSNIEMEDWYFSLVHASDHPANTPTLAPLQAIFQPSDMNHLVTTLDEQPDVIPMRWLNALIGRLFFSYYRTHVLETYIIGRLMKKLSKVKRPAFLTDIVVTEVSVGNTAPTFSKPMLKELTKEGDASLEVHLRYKGEVRITIEATATINLGARFKSYTVKLVLAAVLREIEGNLLVKVKRPPSNRIWYAFTAPPKIVLDVEPIVSDRQITWSMILNTIEARVKEIIQESVVMPNMDDIAFFESSKYSHRGGIWEDASRHDRPAPRTTPGFTASAPVLDGSVPATILTEPEPSRSHSTEELAADTGPPLEGVPIARSTSQEDNNDSNSSLSTSASFNTGTGTGTTRSRRRTWFSTVGSTNLGPLKDEAETAIDDADPPRGRSAEADTLIAPRSKSTPESPRGETPPPSEVKGDTPDYLSPNRQPRSSSRHSQSQSRPSTPSSDDESPPTTDSTSKSQAKVTSSPPRSNNLLSSSPSSFLSTLKSRAAAADKQALSNQAKEAMRKWGVNWGGLRRDGGGSNTNDEGHDVVSSESRTGTDSNNSQKIRASYADVRAAVAERKEREKNNVTEPTEPIAIPEGGRIKVRNVSVSSGNVQIHPPSPSFSAVSTSVSPPSLPRQSSVSSEGGASSKIVAPSVSRSTTGSHSSDPFASDRDLPEGADKLPSGLPSPIHTQPSQAKTMTIPGIHASHRGEVMSMGFVAPPASTENKIKGPAMQSVYRLWKSPILSGQQQQGSESQSQLQTIDAGDRNKDVTPLSLNPEHSPPPPLPAPVRPIPPPLPPRSNTLGANQARPQTPPAIIESPASEALKFIATQDENKRSPPRTPRNSGENSANRIETISHSLSREDIPSTVPATKPPLPPRRVQTLT